MSESQHDPEIPTADMEVAIDHTDESVAERLRHAFLFIDAAHARRPQAPMRELIEEARAAHDLSSAEVMWIKWTLAPDELAVQSKEPDAQR